MRLDALKAADQRTLLFLVGLMVSGCLDLSVPLPPGPGSVTGRVVYTPPGRAQTRPAAGATVTVLGAGLTVTASEEGFFSLEGLVPVKGVLLLRFDLEGDGTAERQRLVKLEGFGLQPNRVNVIGELTVGELGAVSGTVVRADVLSATDGQAGTAIFMPAGPWTTFTANDGRFLLDGLPEGGFQLAFFAAGYRVRSTGSLDLRGGQTVDLGRVVLERDPRGNAPGSVEGSLSFLPAAEGVGDTRVWLTSAAAAVEAEVQAGQVFRARTTLPGLYTLRASRAGYSTALVPNVLVLPTETTEVGQVVLSTGVVLPLPTPQPSPDAGRTEVGVGDGGLDAGLGGGADAGNDAGNDAGLDAGNDGGLDAGSDAGLDAGCRLNQDCALNQWCDDGVCRTPCVTSGDCTNGRQCDLRTGTCVRPCLGGCGPLEVCDLTLDAGSDAGLGVCVRVCDATFLCPTGSRCLAAQVCGPECFVTRDCASPFATCQAGQCVFNGSCELDTDCPSVEMCVRNRCLSRPTARLDGGVTPFVCNAPCDCRLGEVCTSGLCLTDVRPTFYVAADGGGDGLSPARASGQLEALVRDAGPGTVLALRAGDTFVFDGGLSLAARLELSGGWRACGPTRWVRDVMASTSLVRTSAGPVVSVPGSSGSLLADVRVSGLDVVASPPPCTAGLFDVRYAPRARLERLSGSFPAINCSLAGGQGNGGDLVRVVDADDVLVRDVRLGPSGNTEGSLSIVWMQRSDGRLERLELDPQGTHQAIRAVRIEGNSRPVTVDGLSLSDRSAVSVDTGLWLDSGSTVTARNLSIPFGRKSGPGNLISTLVKGYRAPLLLESSAVGLPGFTGQSFPFVVGVEGQDTPLTVRDVTVELPPGGGESAVGVSAVSAPTVLERLSVRGGGSRFEAIGVRINAVSAGINRIVDSSIIVSGSSVGVSGLSTYLVPATAGLTVTNSRLEGSNTGADGRGGGIGAVIDATFALFERSQVLGIGGGVSAGIEFNRGGTAEVVSSYIYSGPSFASGNVQAALRLTSSNGVLVVDSTLDAQGGLAQAAPGAAIYCQGNPGPVIVSGSLLNAGLAPTRRVLSGPPGNCVIPANYTGNHFTFERSGASVLSDDLVIAVLDGGTVDARGNRFVPNAVCLQRPGPSPVLAAGSPCIDQGRYSLRSTNEPVLTDIEGKPRDAGLGPDVGCFERP